MRRSVCVLALSDEKPAPVRQVKSKQSVSAANVQRKSAVGEAASVVVEPGCPTSDKLSQDDRNWLGLVVRRYGVAAFSRPTVADIFKLDAPQRAAVQNLLHEQRAHLAEMVEQAVDNHSTPDAGVIRTQSVRETTTESVLTALKPAQRDLWRSLAGQAPAEGEPVL